MKDFEVVRILLKEETEQIRRMQLSAPEFIKHYPRHREWLDKAIKEVLDGSRTAFGVLKYGIIRKRQPKIELVGSIILKHSVFAPVIELKNLYMRPDARANGYASTLYSNAEEYCAKKGFTTIQTKVPCEEIGTIGFLHKMGFKVVDMGPSPYKKSGYIYQMSKNISVMFNGDVFDFCSQAQWFLENYYGFLDEGMQADNEIKTFSPLVSG
jgi:ribosomal protein S18 acetylase RimI-like enzyme